MIIRQLRILAVLLTLLLALAACSSESPAPVAPSATPTRAPTAVPTTAPTQAPAATPTAVPTQAPAPEPTAAPQPTPTPKPAPNPFEGVQGILDPTNFGWPREVEGLNGLVSIPGQAAAHHHGLGWARRAYVGAGAPEPVSGGGRRYQELDILQRRRAGART